MFASPNTYSLGLCLVASYSVDVTEMKQGSAFTGSATVGDNNGEILKLQKEILSHLQSTKDDKKEILSRLQAMNGDRKIEIRTEPHELGEVSVKQSGGCNIM